MCAARDQADTAAEHQRIRSVALVVEDGPAHRGNAHLISIVFDAMDDAFSNAARMQHALRQIVFGHILLTKEQHIGVGNRACRHTKDIAHHTADSCVGSTERLQCRGVIVRLDLKGEIKLIIEGDNACIVHKGRAHPGFVHRFGGGANIGLQQTPDRLRLTIRPGEINRGAEGFMNAVFAPCLGEHFQFNIRGFAAFTGIVGADGLHLRQIKRETPLFADGKQALITDIGQRNRFNQTIPGMRCDEGRCNRLVEAGALDNGIGKNGVGDVFEVLRGEGRTVKSVSLACRRLLNPGIPQSVGRSNEIFSRRIGNARLQRHVNEGLTLRQGGK